MFAPPRNAFAFLTSCSVSWECACGRRKGISPPAGGDQRALPSGLLPPLKRRAKLFHGGYAAEAYRQLVA
ncbi:MAG: hypothetical protein K2J11_00195 [Oscillospiraceae bacterium]|nr:hypothetical protein [Oscillospiraceae bacterium]